jgi:hypothetical protein
MSRVEQPLASHSRDGRFMAARRRGPADQCIDAGSWANRLMLMLACHGAGG